MPLGLQLSSTTEGLQVRLAWSLLFNSLFFNDPRFIVMLSISLGVFLWAVEGLSKINDSCSFEDVDITLLF